MLPDFKSILDLIKAFPDEDSCVAHLEAIRWNGKVVSPFDSESIVYRCKGNKYKCKSTGKYFNVKVGSIFENTNIPLTKWFLALYIFSSHKKGISSHQLAKDIDVTQKSAWFMLHRLRYAFDHPNFREVLGDGNPVEIDETFIGGKAKNKHASKKRDVKPGGHDKTPVMGMIEREGNIIAKVVSDTTSVSLVPLIRKNVSQGSVIMTDENGAYSVLKRKYDHRTVNHSAKEYVNGMAHTNGIENFWSHLKRGIDGIYHWVSVDHLQVYVNEYTLRFNTRKQTTSARFNLILANVSGRLTYKELVG
jgi:transposase-like protein